MSLQSSATLLLIVACWSIAPATICERRLRALDLKRGWGLVIGSLLGPLGVACVNIYISLQCLWLTHGKTNIGPRPGLAAGRWGEEYKLSARGDMVSLVCLWATILLVGTLLTVDNVTSGGHAEAQPSLTPTRGVSTTVRVQETTDEQSVESLSLQSLNQTKQPGASVNGSKVLTLSGEKQQVARLPSAGGESHAEPAPTAPPAQSNANGTAQSAATGTAAARMPQVKPAGAGVSAGELMRLVVPSELKAHGTLSGSGGATTLTITCADCTYKLGVERLSAGRSRASLKAAGVRIVVIINGPENWTFML